MAEQEIVEVRGMVEGVRLHRLSALLREIALAANVDITINAEKGWFRETVFYKVSGIQANVERFDKILNETIP